MTGTAITEEQEFRDIYYMDVVTVPTNRPILRRDLRDRVYKTKAEKYAAIIKAVSRAHQKGQPVLVGTTTIDVSETLSMLLSKHGLQHNVLNAKNPEQEAAIVAEAGHVGAITIATNMAGRGTDIKLDEKAREAGGLFVIGTERHESRRIDNQLRGRAGRQGDPGKSRFFISLEDDLMRLFGSERYISIFEKVGIKDGMPIEHKMLSKAVEKAQKKVEENHFASRKQLLEYDQVNNDQREIIYKERAMVLKGQDVHEEITGMIRTVIDRKIQEAKKDGALSVVELNRILLPIIPVPSLSKKDVQKRGFEKKLFQEAIGLYEQKEKLLEQMYPGQHIMREVERNILLRIVDANWMEQIDAMEQLRQGIHMVSYGQKDPKVEYRVRGFQMFDLMNKNIQEETVKLLYQVDPVTS